MTSLENQQREEAKKLMILFFIIIWSLAISLIIWLNYGNNETEYLSDVEVASKETTDFLRKSYVHQAFMLRRHLSEQLILKPE